MSVHTAICAICGYDFESRTSYGICPLCWSRDRLREFDRVHMAIKQAERAKLPATLTLLEWMSIASDFNGLCAYCLEMPFTSITMVVPERGLVRANVVPICRACNKHKQHGFDVAHQRILLYLEQEPEEEPASDEVVSSPTEWLSIKELYEEREPVHWWDIPRDRREPW